VQKVKRVRSKAPSISPGEVENDEDFLSPQEFDEMLARTCEESEERLLAGSFATKKPMVEAKKDLG
jgi:hypothetical protein